METSNTTTITWENEVGDTELKYRKCMEKYTYLQDEKYLHKREQLLLMIKQGLSGKFVQSFFQNDANISFFDLDFMRMLAVMTDEEFVMENFYKRKFSSDEARTILTLRIAENYIKDMPRAADILREKENLQSRFELQVNFLQNERESMQAHYQELLAKEVELCRKTEEMKRLQLEHEYTMRTAEAEKQLQRSEGERAALLEKCEFLKMQLSESSARESEQTGYFHALMKKIDSGRLKKEKEQRNEFVLNVISSPRYSPEQLEVILSAVKEGLTLEQLRQLCVPELDVKNMQLLIQFFLKNQEESHG